MMVWLNYSGNLATLKLTIVVEQKILCTSKPTQQLQPEIFKFVKRALSPPPAYPGTLFDG